MDLPRKVKLKSEEKRIFSAVLPETSLASVRAVSGETADFNSTNAATYRLPATRLSGCKTGAPSQADVDRPDPQEVLVSKEACL